MMGEADLLDDDSLIERLLQLAHAGKFLFVEDGWFKYIDEAVSESEIARAEKMLGLSFPPFLKRIYLEVGYHFGPGYGLLRLFTPEGKKVWEKESIVHSTLLQHEYDDDDGEEPFPAAFMAISFWGSDRYYFVDCSQPEYPVTKLSPGEFEYVEAPSLQQWIVNWLKEENLLDDGVGYESS